MKGNEEGKSEAFRYLMLELIEGFRQQSQNSCINTADRRYGRESILEVLRTFEVDSVIVVPEKTMRAHPSRKDLLVKLKSEMSLKLTISSTS